MKRTVKGRCATVKRRERWLCLVFLLVSLTALAQSGEGEVEIRRRIAAAAQAMTTMQCDFVQTKQLGMLNDKMTSEGRMCYSRKDKLRWEYTKPYEYTFIMNGDRVLLKNKERSDVMDVRRNKLFREIAHVMMNSMTGGSLADDGTFKTALVTEGGEWVATLTPLRKDMKGLFTKIVLHFDRRDATVRRVELVEKNGDVTTIDLKRIRKNETVAPSLFAID